MKLKWALYKTVMHILRLHKIDNNKILFCSYHGTNYSGNPRYIAESLLSKDKNLDIVWLASRPLKLPEGMRSVNIKSLDALYEYTTSKVWVDNSRKPVWLSKRYGQFYIQTWHAGIGLKKAEAFAEDALPNDYIKSARHDSDMADMFLSDSKWLTNTYREAFWYTGPILEKGLPREDLLYSNHKGYRIKLIQDFNCSKDTHFVLYAPTFRDSGDLACYNIDYLRLIQTLKAKTGENWKVMVRLHPNIQNKQHLIHYSTDVLNGSKYNDINQLILGSDLFITDYSSCIFDAAIARVPAIIYASDIDMFTKNERGLFFQWNELPFSIATNNNELISLINNINKDNYLQQAQKFLNDCGFIRNNHASSDVAELILEIISGGIK